MALIINSRVVVPFAGVLDGTTSTPLKGTDLEVYVDGVLWNVGTGDVVKDDNYLTLTFDAVYIQTQRLITFTTSTGVANTRFVIKTQVNAIDDVVIKQFSLSDPVPILGTYSTSITVNNPTPLAGTQTTAGLTPYVQPNGTILYYDPNTNQLTPNSGAPLYL